MNEKKREIFNRLAKAEKDFLEREFFAPVLRGQGVQVCISGVRCKLQVEPRYFQGWGIFKPLSHTQAKLVRDANMRERQNYLKMFPALRLILCKQQGGTWHGIPANDSDRRFVIEGAVPVRLSDEVDLFETVLTRFDGAQFWFESPDERVDPGAAGFLRQSLADLDEPAAVARKGLTKQHERAYLMNYAARLEQKLADERARGENRLREALEHAGAQLRDYAERGDVYRVTYTVDGRTHTSVVNKNDLTVHTAGVCLSGYDQNFDLGSLVGVLREGARGNELRFIR